MRRLIVSMNITLNGFMAGPDGELDWHEPYWDEEMGKVIAKQLGDADTLLIGRNTYQCMAPYWQAQQANPSAPRDAADFADMMNRYKKVIFSKTLKTVSWQNARLASRPISKEIMALKALKGKDMVVYGSGKLVTQLIKLNLVDEYLIWIYPVAIKQGRPLFKTRLDIRPYKTRVFDTGVVLMCYKTN
ncbi:dihydrofolate reductase [Mucilaginibacter terrigena]|uniref:Dihydrofolate reductase n=1 Tax=Mucilaginibacter terrigena TaxID=2492395 RepID=A0A4Q5LJ29_9SPHI|nr:dihydrofolate reductase family protein [Mucilaginibacter terrigena]RYU89295.1 dihydrofolate reductase [Mucilaginibacter terrigena]